MKISTNIRATFNTCNFLTYAQQQKHLTTSRTIVIKSTKISSAWKPARTVWASSSTRKFAVHLLAFMASQSWLAPIYCGYTEKIGSGAPDWVAYMDGYLFGQLTWTVTCYYSYVFNAEPERKCFLIVFARTDANTLKFTAVLSFLAGNFVWLSAKWSYPCQVHFPKIYLIRLTYRIVVLFPATLILCHNLLRRSQMHILQRIR